MKVFAIQIRTFIFCCGQTLWWNTRSARGSY